MKPHWTLSRSRTSGFSLLELLVGVGVLTLLIFLVAQMVSGAASVTSDGRKRMKADSQARLVFDRIASDLAGLVCRSDLDILFAKKTGDDQFYFFSEAPANIDTAVALQERSTAALLGYRINNENRLERLGKRLLWSGAYNAADPQKSTGTPVFLTWAPNSNAPVPESTIAGGWPAAIGSAPAFAGGTDLGDFHVLGEDIFRLEICYQMVDGTFSNVPVTQSPGILNQLNASGAPTAGDDASKNYQPGSRWFDQTNARGYRCLSSAEGAAVWRPTGVDDISGVVIAIAVLDNASREIAKSNLTLAGQSLPDTDRAKLILTPPVLASSVWGETLRDPDFARKANIPHAAAANIRVYQRIFGLGGP